MADPMRIRAQASGDKATVRVLMSHEMESGPVSYTHLTLPTTSRV